MESPLAGIKVLEVANYVAVPSTGALMADMGADVVKVERLEGDPWRYLARSREFDYEFPGNFGFELDNRGKRSVTLDLENERAIEVVWKLAERADVMLTNLLPHRMERYRLRYEDLSPRNPRLIFLAFSGYGPAGPDKDRRGLDEVAFWTRSGIVSLIGEPGQPPVDVTSSMGDHITSPVLLSGILAALLARERSGKGQVVTGSLFNSGVWVAGLDLQETLVAGREHRRYERAEKQPLHNRYRTRDGRWFNVVMIHTDANWERLCKAIDGVGPLTGYPYDTVENRVSRAAEIVAKLDAIFCSMTLEELAPRLDANNVQWEPVRGLQEVIQDPQARANGFFAPIKHPNYGPYEIINTPVHFSSSEVGPRGPAPEMGQHTEEVLLELGYTWQDINRLRDCHAIL